MPNYKEVLAANKITDITVLSKRTQSKIDEFEKLNIDVTTSKKFGYRNPKTGEVNPKWIEKLTYLNEDIVDGIADYRASEEFKAEELIKSQNKDIDPPKVKKAASFGFFS